MYMDSGHVFLGILSQTLVQQPLVSFPGFSSAFWLSGNETKGHSFDVNNSVMLHYHTLFEVENVRYSVCVCVYVTKGDYS